MLHRDMLLPEYDHEMAVTRRVLACVPSRDRQWRPHDRAMSLGELAAHVAAIPGWLPTILRDRGYDMARSSSGRSPVPHETTTALLSAFDLQAASGRAAVAAADDHDLLAAWTLTVGQHPVVVLTRFQAVRRYVLSHLVHHRGQLTVFLRQLDARLPSVYGPSADERTRRGPPVPGPAAAGSRASEERFAGPWWTA